MSFRRWFLAIVEPLGSATKVGIGALAAVVLASGSYLVGRSTVREPLAPDETTATQHATTSPRETSETASERPNRSELPRTVAVQPPPKADARLVTFRATARSVQSTLFPERTVRRIRLRGDVRLTAVQLIMTDAKGDHEGDLTVASDDLVIDADEIKVSGVRFTLDSAGGTTIEAASGLHQLEISGPATLTGRGLSAERFGDETELESPVRVRSVFASKDWEASIESTVRWIGAPTRFLSASYGEISWAGDGTVEAGSRRYAAEFLGMTGDLRAAVACEAARSTSRAREPFRSQRQLRPVDRARHRAGPA